MHPARTAAVILFVFLQAGPALSERDAASVFSLEIPSTVSGCKVTDPHFFRPVIRRVYGST